MADATLKRSLGVTRGDSVVALDVSSDNVVDDNRRCKTVATALEVAADLVARDEDPNLRNVVENLHVTEDHVSD